MGWKTQPENLFSILFKSAGSTLGGLPDMMRQRQMARQGGIMTALGLQQGQEQMQQRKNADDAAQMYRDKIIALREEEIAAQERQREMEYKFALLDRLMGPQTSPLDQARIAEIEARTGLLGMDKEKPEKLDIKNVSNPKYDKYLKDFRSKQGPLSEGAPMTPNQFDKVSRVSDWQTYINQSPTALLGGGAGQPTQAPAPQQGVSLDQLDALIMQLEQQLENGQ